MTGSGTIQDPYVITTCQDLQDMSNNETAHYIIANDIDCSGFTFTPIGDYSGFTGSLDGKNYTIKNLTINSGNQNAGIFFVIGTGAIIQNINFDSPVINSNYDSGVLAYVIYPDFQKIENINIYNANVTAGYDAAGLVYEIYFSPNDVSFQRKISHIHIDGTITGKSAAAGFIYTIDSSIPAGASDYLILMECIDVDVVLKSLDSSVSIVDIGGFVTVLRAEVQS